MIAPGPLMTYLHHCQLGISYDDETQLRSPLLFSLLPKLLSAGKLGILKVTVLVLYLGERDLTWWKSHNA
jgi:hypothetical protein